jgi:hypothetical protein
MNRPTDPNYRSAAERREERSANEISRERTLPADSRDLQKAAYLPAFAFGDFLAAGLAAGLAFGDFLAVAFAVVFAGAAFVVFVVFAAAISVAPSNSFGCLFPGKVVSL